MEERILNLLSMCLKAKKKGFNCFFEYAPHVDMISITVYTNRWEKVSKPDLKSHFYMDGTRGEEDAMALVELEAYLKGLIADVG